MNKIFQSIVKNIEKKKDTYGNLLRMDSIFITQGSSTFTHYFNKKINLNLMHSLSKPIISLALGIAIRDGLKFKDTQIDLETKIFPFLKDYVAIKNKNNLDNLNKITLQHALTHSIGYADGLHFKKDIKDKDPFSLIDFILNYPIEFEPGKRFVYSNVGPYLISAIIHEELGINLSEWVDSILFSQIGIRQFEWENYGKYCAGATGLKLNHADLHKIGLLLMNNGSYGNKQIVSQSWIKEMNTLKIKTPNMYNKNHVFPKLGYGFYLWISKNGVFYCDGYNGQNLIIIPKGNILITTCGHQNDMEPIMECFSDLLQ